MDRLQTTRRGASGIRVTEVITSDSERNKKVFINVFKDVNPEGLNKVRNACWEKPTEAFILFGCDNIGVDVVLIGGSYRFLDICNRHTCLYITYIYTCGCGRN